MKKYQTTNNRVLSIAILLAATAVNFGCGENKQAANTSGAVEIRKINGLEYGVLDGARLTTSENSISGTGLFVFKNPLPEEDNHFSLSLTLQASGKATIITNSDPKLQSGVSLTFIRDNTNKISVTMKAGEERQDLSAYYAGADASKPIQLEFEVHPHGHLILGSGDKVEEFDFKTRPTGKFWGLSLENSALISAALSAVQEE